MRRTACALALFLFAAAPANAAPFTPAMNFAYRIADARWGGFPSCTSVDRQIVPDGTLIEQRLGEATIPTAPEPCTVSLTRELARPNEFEHMCAVMIHEGGHLRGLDHSANPRSIMYPTFTFVPRVCMRAGERVINHHYTF